jgi:hypothetical protein
LLLKRKRGRKARTLSSTSTKQSITALHIKNKTKIHTKERTRLIPSPFLSHCRTRVAECPQHLPSSTTCWINYGQSEKCTIFINQNKNPMKELPSFSFFTLSCIYRLEHHTDKTMQLRHNTRTQKDIKEIAISKYM